MNKKYLVTGNWIDKNTGEPMSGIAEVVKGINKNGQPYELVNNQNRENPIEGTYPVRTVLVADIKFTPESSGKPPLKISNRQE